MKLNEHKNRTGKKNIVSASNHTPGVDINAAGSLDGTSIYDVDLDSVEDKTWRKPGADITDYFNYGFNEYTWKAYCTKQKQMQEDQHARKKIHVYESKQEVNSLPSELQSISQPQSGDQDDSVIQVVSSEREAALEEMDPKNSMPDLPPENKAELNF
ncbi:Fip1 motif-domain-containing protein [Gigaspora rosea]|uniref:Fip1 motif-domain-containing protein n=1 Tax=Gigaspora rosea TaxID=44941 RepID=A0A397VU44_9GLOM|nr:Fip1 motif-domain-containing protein [Gigaspora rosea]